MITAGGGSARPAPQRRMARRSCPMASQHPAAIPRGVCWATAPQGGTLVSRERQGAPVGTIPRKAVKTSRDS